MDEIVQDFCSEHSSVIDSRLRFMNDHECRNVPPKHYPERFEPAFEKAIPVLKHLTGILGRLLVFKEDWDIAKASRAAAEGAPAGTLYEHDWVRSRKHTQLNTRAHTCTHTQTRTHTHRRY